MSPPPAGTGSGSPTEPTPNESQRTLIERTDGLHLVDAGAGTGKTFAVTRRSCSDKLVPCEGE